MTLGGDGFKHTAQLTTEIDTDPQLHSYDTVLEITPPFGWLVLERQKRLRSLLLFASTNYALPESKRFPDAAGCQKYGFDPKAKTDADIASVVFGELTY